MALKNNGNRDFREYRKRNSEVGEIKKNREHIDFPDKTTSTN